MNELTWGFLAFGVIVIIGFIIVFLDEGLKWKGGNKIDKKSSKK